MADLGTARARVILDIGNMLTNARRAQDAINDVGRGGAAGMTAMATAIDRNSARITAAGQLLTGFGVVATGVFGVGVMQAANFEQGMDGVAASLGGVGTAAGITEEQFAALSEEALSIGADTSKSATEAAQAMDLLAKAGVDAETILQGTARAAVMVSEATGESLDQSAATMATLSNLFEHTGISAEAMGDVIVNAMNASDASMSELQTGFARLAPVIKGTGMSADEAAASLTYFNMQGFSMAETGTSLASIFQSVVAPATDEAATALENAGIQAFDAQGKFIGFPALFDQVAEATAGMTEEQKANFLSTAFMADGMDLLQTVTEDTGDTLRQAEKDMGQLGTAAENSRTRMDNLKGDIEQLGGAMETLAIRLGSIFLPAFRAVTQVAGRVVDAIAELPTPILAAVGAVTALTGATALLAGGFLLLLPKAAEAYLAFQDFQKWGGLTRVFAGLRTALIGLRAALIGLATTPVVLAAVAVALAGILAYRTNFLGFRDMIDGAREAIASLGEAFRFFRDLGQNPVSAALNAIGQALRRLDIGILNTLADKLGIVATAVQDFWDAFQKVGGTQTANIEVTGDDKVLERIANPDAADGYDYFVRIKNPDGSFKEFGQVMESYTDESDPNIAHVKIKTDEGEYWTTIDNTTGDIGDGTITVDADVEDARSGFQRLDDGLKAMQDRLNQADMPFLANMVGAARVAMTGLEGVLEFLNGLSPAIQNWIIGMGAGLAAIRPLLAIGRGFAAPFISGFGLIKSAATGAIGAIKTFAVGLRLIGAAAFANPIGIAVVAIIALAAAAIYAYKHFEPFRKAVDKAASAVKSFATGPALDFLEGLAEGFMGAIDAIRDFMDGVESVQDFFDDLLGVMDRFRDQTRTAFAAAAAAAGPFRETIQTLGSIFDSVLSAAMAVIGAVAAALRGDWSAAWDHAREAASNAFDAVLAAAELVPNLLIDTFQAIPWTDLWNGIQDAWDAIPWTDMASAGIDLLGAGLSAAGSALAGVWDWITESASNIDWGAVGSTLLSGFQTAWETVEGWLGGLSDLAQAAVTGAWDWLKEKGTTLLNSLRDGFVAGWETARGWLQNLPDATTQAVGGAWNWLREKGSQLLQSLRDGFVVGWETARGWIQALPDAVTQAVGGAWDWLREKGTQLLQSLRDGFVAGWETARGWIQALPDAVTQAVGGAWNWLKDKGTQLLQSLRDGFVAGWETAKSWLTENLQEDTITTLLGGAWNWLKAKGQELLDSLREGFAAGWETARGWLQDLPAAITQAVGNFARLLHSKGLDVIAGLYDGVLDKWAALKGWLAGLVGYIPDAIGDMGEVLKQKGRDLLQGFWDGAKEVWNDFLEWLGARDSEVEVEGELENPRGDDPNVIESDVPALAGGNLFRNMDIAGQLGSALAAALPGMQRAMGSALDSVRDGTVTPKAAEWGAAVRQAGPALGIAAAAAFGATATGASTGLAAVGPAVATQALGWSLGIVAQGAALGAAATSAFGAVRTGATTELAGAAAAVATSTAAMNATAAANLGAMAAGAIASTAGMAAGVAAQASSMASRAGAAATQMSASVTGTVGTMAAQAGTRAAGMASDVTGSINRMRSDATSAASDMGSAVASRITTMSTDSAAQVLGMRMGIAASMLSMQNSATSAANTTRSAVVTAFTNMALQAASAVRSGMSAIPGIISSYTGAARSAGYSVGQAAGAGIVAGLNAMLGAVQAAAQQIVNTVMVAMAAAAQIGSPSRITTRYGTWIGEGLYGGIERTTKAAVRSARDYMGQVLGAFDREAALAPRLEAALARPYDHGTTLAGRLAATEGRGGATHTITNYWNITQQPGQSGEDFARMVARMMEGDYAAAGGV